MLDVKNVSNNDEFFADTPTTPEESVELCRKQQCLKEVINKRKAIYWVSKSNGHLKGLIKLGIKLSTIITLSNIN